MVLEFCLEYVTGESAMLYSGADCYGVDCYGVLGDVDFYVFLGVDLRVSDGVFVVMVVCWGLEEFLNMVEIYSFGGVGDRFGLVDVEIGESLFVVFLLYNGWFFIEGFVCDLIV